MWSLSLLMTTSGTIRHLMTILGTTSHLITARIIHPQLLSNSGTNIEQSRNKQHFQLELSISLTKFNCFENQAHASFYTGFNPIVHEQVEFQNALNVTYDLKGQFSIKNTNALVSDTITSDTLDKESVTLYLQHCTCSTVPVKQ